MSTKHYVEFFFPGSFVSESDVRQVQSRDSEPDYIPPSCYGYRFFSRTEVQHDGETLIGKNTNYSPMTFFGETYTLAEVEALNDDSLRILLSNMRCNGYARVVKTRRGNWQPLNEGDEVKP